MRLGYPTESHGRIPGFANIEEEAAFWDTHDFTDFAREATPVRVTVGRTLADRFAARQTQADAPRVQPDRVNRNR